MPNKSLLNKNILFALLLVITIVAGGWLINYFMSKSQSQINTAENHRQVIDQYFNTALAFMQKKQYQPAVHQWQQLLALNPEIAEAHVNLGFSLYELGKYASAIESFNQAMDINSYQLNAYYGLAICYEKTGDIKAAIGAMRSFIHLSEKDDPFVRKAKAALWEWESQLPKADVKNQIK